MSRTAWLHHLLLAAALVFLFRHVVFSGETFYERDLQVFHRPVRMLVARLARESGGLPLWNPLVAAGKPFAANPHHAVFHPLSALLFVLPFEWAWRLFVLLPVLAAGIAMRFLVRVLGGSQRAALLGAIAWGFGGVILSATNLPPILLAASMLPATLAFAVRIGRERSLPRDIAGLGVCFGLQCLGGEPATLLATVALVPLAVWHGATLAGSPRLRRCAIGALAGIGLGAAVAGAALLPGMALARASARASGVPDADAMSWSLPPVRLAELWLAPALGPTSAGARDWSNLAPRYPGRSAPLLFSLYPGALVSLTALVAGVLGGAASRVWLGASAAGFALAVGTHLPLWRFAHALPVVASVRYPEKLALPALLAWTVAGALGFDHVARRTRLAPRLLDLLVAVTLADSLLAGGRIAPSRPVAEVAAAPEVLAPLLTAPREGYLFHEASYRALPGDPPAPAEPPFPSAFGIATALDRDFDLSEGRASGEAKHWMSLALEQEPRLAGPLLARRGIAAVLRRTTDPSGANRGFDVIAVRGAQPYAFFASRAVEAEGGEGWLATVTTGAADLSSTVVLAPDDARSLAAPLTGGAVLAVDRTPVAITLDVAVSGDGLGLLALNQTWDGGWRATIDGKTAPLLRADLSLTALWVPPGPHRIRIDYHAPLVTAGLALSLAALGLCLLLARKSGSRAS